MNAVGNAPPPRFWCPICNRELKAVEEVSEERWPAGAPRAKPHLVRREYTVRRCSSGHVLFQHGGVLCSSMDNLWT